MLLALAFIATAVVSAFGGLVGGAFMTKIERRAWEVERRDLRRANTYMASQIKDKSATGAPSSSASPSHTGGR